MFSKYCLIFFPLSKAHCFLFFVFFSHCTQKQVFTEGADTLPVNSMCGMSGFFRGKIKLGKEGRYHRWAIECFFPKISKLHMITLDKNFYAMIRCIR